ncbi:MAG: flavin reductase family protein [Chloroflexi bacterium]|jgi:flavin reductase|nr:flavin reductase family protein [Chloroflexota bacterium]MBT3670025.1 flavin reductase family protein [Chloroflexota bacterium]MBT4003026.1 flavin reductase family protein [Chloroflexota bacterium]MBT4306773.1 flavin reductase family protein [Chloroflexota bacterium]MBT4532911.1 flavin reductase family protein [Chloroflexota bacterium]
MSDKEISNALNMIPYGFYALTSRNGDDRNVMVLNWFSQVSFKPQHVAIGLQKNSYTFGLINQSRKFIVNIFQKDGAKIIKAFSKSREKNPEKFDNVEFTDGPVTRVPVLDGAAAYIECEVIDIVDTNSGHSVVVAVVVGGDVITDGKVEETLTLQDLGWNYSG